MDRHVDAVLARSREVMDRVRAYEIRILACQARALVTEGVAAALDILGQLGCTFPESPTPEDVGVYLGQVAEAIGERSVEDLLEVRTNPDPEGVAAIRLLVDITSTAYIGAPALFPLIVLEAVARSARDGDTGASAYAYVTYGIILCGVLEQSRSATVSGRSARRSSRSTTPANTRRAPATSPTASCGSGSSISGTPGPPIWPATSSAWRRGTRSSPPGHS